MSQTISAARLAEANLVNQLNATADALAQFATNNVAAALERVRAEAQALKARVSAANATVAEELAGVLACLGGLTAELTAGLEAPAPVSAPTVPAPIAEAPATAT